MKKFDRSRRKREVFPKQKNQGKNLGKRLRIKKKIKKLAEIANEEHSRKIGGKKHRDSNKKQNIDMR